MLQWLKYKQRLQNVRGELAELEEEMGTLPIRGDQKELAAVAAGVGKISGILGRVIDSLPG